jgi:hypothetical protein
VHVALRRSLLLPLVATPAVALGAAMFVGCNNVNVRGDGLPETFTDSAKIKRPDEKESKPFGFSQKARDIEADLGVK